MNESIKKFFKNESLLMKTFPWTINLTNIFFLRKKLLKKLNDKPCYNNSVTVE